MKLNNLLKQCIEIINNEGWKLPDNIKVRTANNYYKDKPFSPSYVDRDTKTIYVMSSINNEEIAKRLIMHELIHLTDMKNYSHSGDFRKRTNLINKKYHLNLPYAAEDTLGYLFNMIPALKKQAYEIVSKNSGVPVGALTQREVMKDRPDRIAKRKRYFNY